MDEQEFEKITMEEYIKFLHISISHIEEPDYRTDMIKHLGEVKDQFDHLENCYSLPSYEPERSV